MILIHYTKSGLKRLTDLTDIYKDKTILLLGGAPSLKEQPLELLKQNGILVAAMNNAAIHVRPTLWFSGDHPECYEPQILYDPTITKFAPLPFADIKINGKKYSELPNVNFYIQQDGVTWDKYFNNQPNVPWYNNTLLVSIHILYQLGSRQIILGGSDFGFVGNKIYAHDTKLGSLEQKWNQDLYNGLVKELRLLKPIFEQAGLTLMDCSKNSRIGQVYQHITMEEAIKRCLEGFPTKPVDPASLPHCSKFAPQNIKDKIANWPGHNGEFDGYFVKAPEQNAMQPLI
jgi:hypothetical protein